MEKALDKRLAELVKVMNEIRLEVRSLNKILVGILENFDVGTDEIEETKSDSGHLEIHEIVKDSFF